MAAKPEIEAFTLDNRRSWSGKQTASLQGSRPASQLLRPDTPPNSADQSSLNSSTSGDAPQATPLTIEHVERLIVKLIEAKSKDPSDDSKPDAKPSDAQPKIARASKLEFKTVNEVYVFN
jgi:hypothetical protein